MKKVDIRFITQTAILLALTITFQAIGRFIPIGPNSNFVVGPLVNACLIVATAATGLLSGTIIALISPFGAILTGATLPIAFAPFVAIGNFLIVLFFFLLRKKKLVGIFIGSIVKFAFLYTSIVYYAKLMKLPVKQAAAMTFAFGWPQLVTALIGGFIALILIKSLKKYINYKSI